MSKNIFFNRELSWIEFNARVLNQATRKDLPLLDRIQFLSIVTSNFNEFFQVRVASIKRLLKINPHKKDISGFTPSTLLRQISERSNQIIKQKNQCLQTEIFPLLEKEGFTYVKPENFTSEQKNFCQKEFNQKVLPLLTPLRTDTNIFPKINNLIYHVAFLLKPIQDIKPTNKDLFVQTGKQAIALVQIPIGIPRLIWLPSHSKNKQFTFLENLIDTDMTVNHKDGDRRNNMIDNLEWLSRKDNIRYGFNNGQYDSFCKKVILKNENKKRDVLM